MSRWRKLVDEVRNGPAGKRDAPPAPAVPPTSVDVTGEDYMAVVGESFNRTALGAVTGGGVGMHTVDVALVRQPENPYDKNAIAVVVRGQIVGHLARENAERFADGLDAVGGTATCTADIRRTDLGRDWNVVLHVDYDVLNDLTD